MRTNGNGNGVAPILDKALSGERISDGEALVLLESRDLVSVGRRDRVKVGQVEQDQAAQRRLVVRVQRA